MLNLMACRILFHAEFYFMQISNCVIPLRQSLSPLRLGSTTRSASSSAAQNASGSSQRPSNPTASPNGTPSSVQNSPKSRTPRNSNTIAIRDMINGEYGEDGDLADEVQSSSAIVVAKPKVQFYELPLDHLAEFLTMQEAVRKGLGECRRP